MATQLIYDYDALVRLIARIERAEIASCELNEDATALLAKLRRIRFNMPRGVTVAIDLDELAKMLLAALKRIRDKGPIEKEKGICGNVRLLVPRKRKSTASHSVGPNTKGLVWMAVSRECETRHSVEEPAPHLPAQLHDKGAGK